MGMSEHTALPWTLHKREDEEQATLIKHVGDAQDFLVCQTNVEWRYQQLNGANAAFIVEAVNSYYAHKDAIRELVDALKDAERQMTFEDMLLPENAELRSALQIVQDAIKKHGNEGVTSIGEKTDDTRSNTPNREASE
jgi:hypothetical protein